MPGYTEDDLAEWCKAYWSPFPPVRVNGISKDTRTILDYEVYIALEGENFNGHDFVGKAFAKNASGVIVSEKWWNTVENTITWESNGPIMAVADTRKALKDMASGYRKRLGAKVIAVTGSAGKTTVKEMIMSVLSMKGKTGGTRGNYNNEIGVPLSVLGLDGDEDYAVFEMGTSASGEIRKLAKIVDPEWGLVTNVAPAHIEYFKDMDAIAEEKASLIAGLSADGAAFLNADCEKFKEVRKHAKCQVVTVSVDGKDADYSCVERNVGRNEIVVREKNTGRIVILKMFLPGRHNAANALFAVAVGRFAGINWDLIGEVLANFKSVSMRWEEVTLGGVRIINDAYNANPLSMRASIDTFLESPCSGHRWLVFSGMLELGDREREEHISVGRYIANCLLNGNSRSRVKLVTVGKLGGLIALGAESAGMNGEDIMVCDHNAEASRFLLERVGNLDEVLLKASRGMKLEEVLHELAGRSI